MGTPDFAVASLARLYEAGHDIVGVFTQPDKPKNRGMKLSASPVKELAMEHNTPVYQPASLKNAEVMDALRALAPELIAVVAYGKLLPREVLELPPLGCVNIHGSVLPKYRGSAPIQWEVLNGEKQAGVTAMYMAEEMDAGDIIAIETTEIGEYETAGELYARLGLLGAGLLCKTLDAISRGTAVRTPQDSAEATFAPPLTKELSPIDWSQTAFVVLRKILGLNPWPIATTELAGTNFKVYAAIEGADDTAAKPGEIVSSGNAGLEVACADGTVIITELQVPGGKRMRAGDYLRGHPICK